MSLHTAQTPPKEFTLDLGEVDIRQRWQTRPPKQFPSPWACEWGFDEYGLWQCFQVKGIKQKMRYIPPGEFWMGSPEDEPERDDDETLHHVTLKEGFWLGETTVTQALWQAVMGNNPSEFKASSGEQLPVESVSWNDCQGFMGRLKNMNFLFDFTFPTEAQWEYACRAGKKTPFNTGEQLTSEQANYDGDCEYNGRVKLTPLQKQAQKNRQKTVEVNAFKANAWGLKQMHGNVWEWCADSRRQYLAEPEGDPVGAINSEQRAVRGGSWIDDAGFCRSAYRNDYGRDDRYDNFGLRLSGF